MNYQSLAFFTGLFGSLHCVMMCGPLVMALPTSQNTWTSLFQKLIYQAGRICTYGVVGFLAGSLGSILNILGFQQILSIVTGAVLVAIGFTHFTSSTSRWNQVQNKILAPIIQVLSRWMARPGGSLYAGMLHGLIPCGMVYMALAGSLSTGSSFKGAEFMLYFGLGTSPLLLLTSFAPIFFRRLRVSKLLIPVLFLVSGGILIVRGLNQPVGDLYKPVQVSQPAVC